MSIGLAYGATIALHYVGLSFLFAAYYIAIKRLSIVCDVFFGWFVYREKYFSKRIAGALLMVAGIILIAFG